MLRDFLLWHLILVPVVVWILVDDMNHPELWGVWYHNPDMVIPYCVVLDLFVLVACVRINRRQRHTKGMWLLQEALRLQAAGELEAAEAAYREGRKLLRMPPER